MTDDKKIDQIAQVGIDTLKLYPGLKAEWRVNNTEAGQPRIQPLDRGSEIMLGRMANLDSDQIVTDRELTAAFGQVTQWLEDASLSGRVVKAEPVKGVKSNTDIIYKVSKVQDALEQA